MITLSQAGLAAAIKEIRSDLAGMSTWMVNYNSMISDQDMMTDMKKSSPLILMLLNHRKELQNDHPSFSVDFSRLTWRCCLGWLLNRTDRKRTSYVGKCGWPIQTAVANASTYVPTVESIIATAASLFGPQYAVIVAAGTAAFNQIVATLVNVVANLSPAASAKLGVRLKASSPQVPVTIGKTPAGVVIHGWRS